MSATLRPDPSGLRRRAVRLSLLGTPVALGGALLASPPADGPVPAEGLPVAIVDSLERLGTITGPESGESGWDMFIDDDGNLFTVGHHGGLDTDRDGRVDRSAQSIDPMFIKSRPDGTVTWLVTPQTPDFSEARSIASDRAGGLYGVGHVKQGGMRIEEGVTLQSSGTWDAYLMRLDANGRFLWARTTRGDSIESFADVASDRDGNVYVAAMGYRTFRLEGHENEIEAQTGLAQVLASYDGNGNARWLRAWPDARGWRLTSLATDAAGTLWMAGWHGSAGVDLDRDGNAELAGREGFNGFIARFGSDGDLLDAWQIAALGTGDRAGASIVEIVFADDGDVVTGGTIVGPVDFDGDGQADARPPDGVFSGGYVARYSPEGELRWARSHVIDTVWDIATDGRRFALAGFYAGERDLNQDGAIDDRDGLRDTRGDDDPESDILVVVLDDDGRFAHHINAPAIGGDQARSIAFVPDRSALWVTGFFKLAADFDGTLRDGEAYIRCDALGDIFWALYGLIERESEPGERPF